MSETRSIDVERVRAGDRSADTDRVAIEEPLEIRLHGRPFAVIMRTPGADRELAAGFLYAERVVMSADDLGAIERCTDPGVENVVNVTLANGSSERLEQLLADRRLTGVSSSCGLCGRQTIESLLTDVEPLRAEWTIGAATLAGLPERLRARQVAFERRAGCTRRDYLRRTARWSISPRTWADTMRSIRSSAVC
jgi:Uncharacterized protein required for formate dehydrogenase activity